MLCNLLARFTEVKGFLRLGATGPDVGLVQRCLEAIEPDYYSGRIDFDYGKLTERGVIRFQLDRILAPDGVVGPKTRKALADSVCAGWHPGEPFAHPWIDSLVYGGEHPAMGQIPGVYGRISTFGGPYDPYDRVWGQAYISGVKESPAALAIRHPGLVELGVFRQDLYQIKEWPLVKYRTIGGWAEKPKRASTSWALDSERGYYCAMRFRPGPSHYRNASNPRVLVWSDVTRKAVVCLRTDYGPRSRMIDVSPCALNALGLKTDDRVSACYALDDAPLGPVAWRQK